MLAMMMRDGGVDEGGSVDEWRCGEMKRKRLIAYYWWLIRQ